jgi:RNA polymerase sigma-70 factor (ECF subfamily)
MRIFVPLGGPSDQDAPLPEVTDADERVDDVLARRQIVERALATLPDDLRLAVTLRDVQGLDYKEIAAALGVPIGTVESRIFRARQKLRPLLVALLDREDGKRR